MSDDSLFKDYRPNEYKPQLLNVSSVNPWLGHVSSPRVQMLNSQMQQTLHVADATDKRCFTGTEMLFGEYTFGHRVPEDSEVIEIIPRYPRRIGPDAVEENPESLLVFEYKKELSNGDTVLEIDCMQLHTHQRHHQSYGRRYNYQYNDNNMPRHLRKGEPIAQSPSIGENGNYRFGLEANVAMMSIPQIIEDGIVASESFCRRMTTTGIRSYIVSFGKKEYPLNLYGDDNYYKIIPEIGEHVNDHGELIALRRYEDRFEPVNMMRSRLKESDYKYDRCIYTHPGAKVVDVRVQHDPRYHSSRTRHTKARRSSPRTPLGMADQPERYWEMEIIYYEKVVSLYKRLKRNNPDLHISKRFQRLIVEAMAMTEVDPSNQRIEYTYRTAPIDEWRMEIMVEYPVVPTVGFKISGLHGD